MKKTALLHVVLFAAVAVLSARGQEAMDWLQAADGASHLTFPRYTGSDKKLYVVVHVDSVKTEYEKHGFFRIGVLPIAVLDGFTYEVREPAAAMENLARLPDWLGGEGGRHVELRNVKFVASPLVTLEGKGIRFLSHDRWELTGSVRFVSGTNEFRAEKATWRVAGAEAGELILQSSPPTTNTFLFNKALENSNKVAINTPSK